MLTSQAVLLIHPHFVTIEKAQLGSRGRLKVLTVILIVVVLADIKELFIVLEARRDGRNRQSKKQQRELKRQIGTGSIVPEASRLEELRIKLSVASLALSQGPVGPLTGGDNELALVRLKLGREDVVDGRGWLSERLFKLC